MSINYVDYDYWEYGYAYGDIRYIEASANVNANVSLVVNGVAIYSGQAVVLTSATVATNYVRIRLNDADITAFADATALGGVLYNGIANVFADAQVASEAIRIRTANADVAGTLYFSADGHSLALASASIYADATVSVSGYRIRYASANIQTNANLSANAYRIRYTEANINATANVEANAFATYSRVAGITSSLVITAEGTILGQEWVDSPVDTNTWLWVSNPLYVELGYWVVGYVEEAEALWFKETESSDSWSVIAPTINNWADSSVSNNTWFRQG